MLRKLQSRRNILAISAGLLVLLGTTAAIAPRQTRADGGLPIRATFSVAYAGAPNTTARVFAEDRATKLTWRHTAQAPLHLVPCCSRSTRQCKQRAARPWLPPIVHREWGNPERHL